MKKVLSGVLSLLFCAALVIVIGVGSSWFTNFNIRTWFDSWGKGGTRSTSLNETEYAVNRLSAETDLPYQVIYETHIGRGYSEQRELDNVLYGKDTISVVERIQTTEGDWVEQTVFYNIPSNLIIHRQYSYLPINVYVSYNDGDSLIKELYGTFEVLFAVDTVFCVDEFLVDYRVNEIVPPAMTSDYVRSLIDSGKITSSNIMASDYCYAVIDFSDIIANGFCHEDFGTTVRDYNVKLWSRDGLLYAALGRSGCLQLAAFAESVPDIIFELNHEDGNNENIKPLISGEHEEHEHPLLFSLFEGNISPNGITEYSVAGSETLFEWLSTFEPSVHRCGSVCAVCGRCCNADCLETTCNKKCTFQERSDPNHYCETWCGVCGLCREPHCTGVNCVEKCTCVPDNPDDPNHECKSLCPDCGLCQNESCTGVNCVEKCNCVPDNPDDPNHECKSPCPDCGLCQNKNCTGGELRWEVSL